MLRLLAVLRHRRFFSVAELNTAIWALLPSLNGRVMKHLGVFRRQLFEQLDRPLPRARCLPPATRSPARCPRRRHRWRLGIAAILALMSSVARAAWWASSLISLATTANPLPSAPARAASVVAFKARSFVCEAMSVMVGGDLADLGRGPAQLLHALRDRVGPAARLIAVAHALALFAAISPTVALALISVAAASAVRFADACSVLAATDSVLTALEH